MAIDLYPHSMELEQAFLGCCLIDPENTRDIVITPQDFYIGRNRMVFESIRRLQEQKVTPDYLTIANDMQSAGTLKEVGGPAYLTGLLTNVPSTFNAPDYAVKLSEYRRRRTILQIAQRLTLGAQDLDSNITNLVATASTDLVNSVMVAAGSLPIDKVISKLYDELLEAYQNPQDIYGLPTGFPTWDNFLGGIQKSETLILTGEPGCGKSFLAFQVGSNMAANGHAGITFSLEMDDVAIVRRKLSALARVHTKAMRSGHMGEDDWERLSEAQGTACQWPIYLNDQTNMDTTTIRAEVCRLMTQVPVEWIIVDYLALLQDCPELDEIQRSAVISGRLHAIAKDLDIACIVVNDMVKAGMNGGVIGQAKLAGSRRVAYDADQIVTLKKRDEDKKTMRLEWDKNREGECPFIDLQKFTGFPAFGELYVPKPTVELKA